MEEGKVKNYAFIDGQNLNLGIRALGWHLDFRGTGKACFHG